MKYLFLTLILIINSCNASDPSTINTKDSIVTKEIPRDANGDFFWYYSEKKIIDTALSLPSLENGYDTLELRVYYGIKDDFELITIKKNKTNWQAKSYSFTYTDKSKIKLIREEEILPVNGWKNLVDSINSFGVLEINPLNTRNGSSDCFDGDGVTIEIATQKHYKIFNYSCLASSARTDKDAGKVSKMLSFFIREFPAFKK